jgi:hypothetical protein
MRDAPRVSRPNMANISWLIVNFGDDILSERLGFKALSSAIPPK